MEAWMAHQFGERDKWWGWVTEGFYDPCTAMNFNPLCYKDRWKTLDSGLLLPACFSMDYKKPLNDKLYDETKCCPPDPLQRRMLDKKELLKYAEICGYL